MTLHRSLGTAPRSEHSEHHAHCRLWSRAAAVRDRTRAAAHALMGHAARRFRTRVSASASVHDAAWHSGLFARAPSSNRGHRRLRPLTVNHTTRTTDPGGARPTQESTWPFGVRHPSVSGPRRPARARYP